MATLLIKFHQKKIESIVSQRIPGDIIVVPVTHIRSPGVRLAHVRALSLDRGLVPGRITKNIQSMNGREAIQGKKITKKNHPDQPSISTSINSHIFHPNFMNR